MNTIQGAARRFARKALICGALGLVPVCAWSADLTIPNTFAAGTPAKASDVNANFSATAAAVNSLGSRIAALEAQQPSQLGFAHVVTVGTTSGVGTFGGTGTTAVAVIRQGVGSYTVTFTGNYPATIDASKIVLLSTATSGSFQVTNNFVVSANATTIVVGVFTWTTNVLNVTDGSFDVLVLLGS